MNGVNLMHTKSHNNPSIECSIYSCAHHSKDAGYCALDRIQVGTHESDPSVVECTDCQSFEKN